MMTKALIEASRIDLGAYIKLYRLCLLQCMAAQLPQASKQKIYNHVRLNASELEYQDMVKTVNEMYDKVKDLNYKDSPIKDWCSAIVNIDFTCPLANRWTDFPLASRHAVSQILNKNKGEFAQYHNTDLQSVLGNTPFEDFEQLLKNKNIDYAKNAIIIDRAYLLMLHNAYLYYYDDYDSLSVNSKYNTSDAQWDWLSKQLSHIKNKLNPKRYPILFDSRFEGGQSLFWLSKEQYPPQAIV